MKIAKSLTALALVLSATSALAEPRQGNKIISAQVGEFYMTDYDNMAALILSAEIFYTKNISIGGRIEGGFGSDSAISALGQVAYYFTDLKGPILPYAGANLGITSVNVDDESHKGLKTGVFGGGSYALDPRISLFLEAQTGYFIAEENSSFIGLGIGAKYMF